MKAVQRRVAGKLVWGRRAQKGQMLDPNPGGLGEKATSLREPDHSLASMEGNPGCLSLRHSPGLSWSFGFRLPRVGPRQAARETLPSAVAPRVPFPTSSPASRIVRGGLYQLPDKESLGVTNVWAGNSILAAWVGTRERKVAKVHGKKPVMWHPPYS